MALGPFCQPVLRLHHAGHRRELIGSEQQISFAANVGVTLQTDYEYQCKHGMSFQRTHSPGRIPIDGLPGRSSLKDSVFEVPCRFLLRQSVFCTHSTLIDVKSVTIVFEMGKDIVTNPAHSILQRTWRCA